MDGIDSFDEFTSFPRIVWDCLDDFPVFGPFSALDFTLLPSILTLGLIAWLLKSMVYQRKSQSNMDDDWGLPPYIAIPKKIGCRN